MNDITIKQLGTTAKESVINYSVLDIPIFPLTFDALIELIDLRIKTAEKLFIATVGAETIMKAYKYPFFKDILKNVSLNIPDGAGVVWAINFLYKKKIQRTPGIDLLNLICTYAEKQKWKLFFLGAKQNVLEQAILNLKRQYSGLNITGSYHGYFSPEMSASVVQKINDCAPDILFVAMGAPKQEIWIFENMLKLHPSIFIGIGGSLDVISGRLKRAPLWMQKANLEWFYRTIQEPNRIKRQWMLPLFVIKVFSQKIKMVFKREWFR